MYHSYIIYGLPLRRKVSKTMYILSCTGKGRSENATGQDGPFLGPWFLTATLVYQKEDTE